LLGNRITIIKRTDVVLLVDSIRLIFLL